MIKIYLKTLIVLLVLSSCKTEITRTNQETVLDNISHIEDSIYHEIDSLPMLCDVLGMEKQLVDIGDCKLYCETEGKGIPMVVINGGPGGTHHYFHPWFSEAAKYCRVIYYDQRGCGQSDFNPGKDGYSFEQAVDDLDKLRQKLGIEKWIVCGYSYGGAVAQFYTATHPENTLGMVLIGAKPMVKDNALSGSRQNDYISSEEKQKIREIYKLYHDHQINLQQLLYNKGINGDWKRQNYYKPTNDEFIRQAYYEWVNDNGFNSSVSATVARYSFEHLFDNCPIPTLLCEGEYDLTWNAEKKEIIRKNHPNAEFVLFEKSGHNIYYDEPDLFFSTLKNFVKHLQPATANEIGEWKKQVDKILGAQQRLFQQEAAFFELIEKDGIEKAIEYYKTFKTKNKGEKLFTENGMNSFGYFSYLKKNDYETAIKLFEMNVAEYPDSWNVYDSLGEAYLVAGNKKKAKENYKKSVGLNPDNTNGKNVLKELE
nr:alpha/beta hydrolase [uncultured Draconibacterium sp.]